MPVLKGKTKFTATKAYQIGDVIELEADADIAQDVFDEAVKGRLKREEEKQAQLVERIEKQATEIADLKKKAEAGTGSPAKDEALAKRIEEMELKSKKLEAELKQRDHESKVRSRIEEKAKDLPSIFREKVKVKEDADDDVIDAAIDSQVEAYKKFQEEHGLTRKEGSESVQEDVGRGGNGAPAKKSTTAGAKAVEEVNKVPSLAKILSSPQYDQATREAVAQNWLTDGTLAKAKETASAK